MASSSTAAVLGGGRPKWMQGSAGGSEDGDEGWKDVHEQGKKLFVKSSCPCHQYSLLFIMQIT